MQLQQLYYHFLRVSDAAVACSSGSKGKHIRQYPAAGLFIFSFLTGPDNHLYLLDSRGFYCYCSSILYRVELSSMARRLTRNMLREFDSLLRNLVDSPLVIKSMHGLTVCTADKKHYGRSTLNGVGKLCAGFILFYMLC